MVGIENKAPKVIVSALNRTMTNLASNISKEIRVNYTAKASDIKESLVKVRATPTNMSATVRSKGSVIGLDKFKVTPKTVQPKRKKPIKAGVKKDATKSMGSAFVADINGIKVFVRTSKKRLSLKRLYGPSIPQMLKNEKVKDKLQIKAEDMFKKRLEHEISRLLGDG